MGMKVDRVLGIMELARPLLERYRGCSVEDMIIDLVAKCGGGAEMLEAASLAGARVGKPATLPATGVVPPSSNEVRSEGGEIHLGAGVGGEEASPASGRAPVGRGKRNEADKAEKKLRAGAKKTPVEDVGAVVAELESMDTAEMRSYLESFLKKDLEEIAARLNLKGLSGRSKPHIASRIVRYYEEKRLPERIAQRAPADDEAFKEEMRKKYGF